MALYSVDVEARSPLQIQITAPSTGPVWIKGWEVHGDDTFGVTSRPVLYRPSQPGTSRASTETATITMLSRSGKVPAQATVMTVFTVPPSLPAVVQNSPALPYRASARFEPGILLMPEEAICLYATTDFEASVGTDNDSTARVHTWSGTLIWEES